MNTKIDNLPYKVKDITLAEWGEKKLHWQRLKCQA